jgi:pimeloyl-ACP methyl ester carboxylesterase
MNQLHALILSMLAASGSMTCLNGAHAASGSPVGTYISIPDTVTSPSGAQVPVERGLFFVNENRVNANSRPIAIHFLRFRALSNSTAADVRAPVFVLPGGPGSEYDFSQPGLLRKVQYMQRTRDVIYVSQRGNPKAPGLAPPLWVTPLPAPLDQPASPAATRKSQRDAFNLELARWSTLGVDLSGYDILNIVDDLYELRAALGYGKVILYGCSFGSQWSLAYLKRWPDTVDRALLSGVEPLDYAYDSPDDVWSSLARLARSAEADPRLAGQIPAEGLIKAVETVIERLEQHPVDVVIDDPNTGKEITIAIGLDDLRPLLASALHFKKGTKRQNLAHWPRFIIEIYRGDYRYLAAQVLQSRRQPARETMIVALIDNSLGITEARDARMRAEKGSRWLGDINDYYRNTRDLVPTPNVGDAFRADWEISIPVLLLNGDTDWSTPLENAIHARGYLRQGHLVTVQGGTHCTENDELPELLPQVAQQVFGFVDADFSRSSPKKFFATLPRTVTYPPIEFASPAGVTLYEEWQEQQAASK